MRELMIRFTAEQLRLPADQLAAVVPPVSRESSSTEHDKE
jgi:hypothetical protein